jgi:hypothetical protein
MAPIPPGLIAPPQLTIDAIYEWYRNSKENWDSLGINVGDLGGPCNRQLWYNLHWASYGEAIGGRNARLMQIGNLEESRFEEDLRNVGVDVYGAQDKIRLVGGHVRGKRDGAGVGFLEAPITEHLTEFKTSNTKNFAKIVHLGVKVAKPQHYGQCQLGMGYFGLTWCFYLVKNKDDESLHSERIEFDVEYYLKLLARAESIVRSDTPPARISEKLDWHECLFCKHTAVCKLDAQPRVNCRTCIFATAEMGGSDAMWTCGYHNKPLTFDEQKVACNFHLYNPEMVAGEQTDSSEDEHWIEYTRSDGSIWRDGVTA